MELLQDDTGFSVPVTSMTDWWDKFVHENYPDEECLKHFKCSRRTYIHLVKSLKPYIAPKVGILPDQESLYFRKGVSVEKQVAILLYKLTTCADYVKISQKFKVHKTTIHKILYKCIVAINKYMLHDIVTMPSDSEAEVIAHLFETAQKIPQVIGVLSMIHIPICSPINLNYQFLNTKLYTSFVLQVVIDSNYQFRDVSVRHAGAKEHHFILKDSNIYKYSQKVMPVANININDVDVPYKIIGPSNGPHLSWLLNNYTEVKSNDEVVFNNCLDEIRNYADSVIARLRSRFLILSQMLDLSYKVAPQLIAACCIIHNICENEGDPFLDEWLTESSEKLKIFPQPEIKKESLQVDEVVLKERDVLKDYVNMKETENNSVSI